MTFYQSEVTHFIKKLYEQNPQLKDQQKQGRALLWDKSKINLDDYARNKQSSIKQKPYVYSTE